MSTTTHTLPIKIQYLPPTKGAPQQNAKSRLLTHLMNAEKAKVAPHVRKMHT